MYHDEFSIRYTDDGDVYFYHVVSRHGHYLLMSKERENGRKWDGRSRVSNDRYKKNWNDIFGKRSQEEIEERLWQNLKDWNLKKDSKRR